MALRIISWAVAFRNFVIRDGLIVNLSLIKGTPIPFLVGPRGIFVLSFLAKGVMCSGPNPNF